MAETAFQIQYRQEFIAAFEDRQSILRATTVQEAQVKGNQAVFLVAGSGSATAVTRGVQGLIPARADSLTQQTATLQEWHDLVRRTGFNLFASQGDGRRIMQETSMGVINRKIDDLIIAALDAASNHTTTSAVTASVDLVINAQTILGNNYVDLTDEDNLFMLISPAFSGYMMQAPEYAGSDYVDIQPFTGPARRFRRFMGFNWMIHSRLTNSVGAGGTGTSTQCYAYHRTAVGAAVDTAGIQAEADFDREQAYNWARTTIYAGALVLQNSGIVMIRHNDAGYAAV